MYGVALLQIKIIDYDGCIEKGVKSMFLKKRTFAKIFHCLC